MDDVQWKYWKDDGEQSRKVFCKRKNNAHWVGDAYENFQENRYDCLQWQCFKRTGCLIIADTSDDNKIKPEGILDHGFHAILACEDPIEFIAPVMIHF